MVHGALSAIHEFPRRESTNSRRRPPQNLEIRLLGLQGLTLGYFLFLPDGWGIPGTINCFRSELILAAAQNTRFQLVHGTLYICYSVRYA